MTDQELGCLRELFDLSKKIADEISWGTGSTAGSFNVKFSAFGTKSLYTVRSDGEFWFNFGWLDWESSEDLIQRLKIELQDRVGIAASDEYDNGYMRVDLPVWSSGVRPIVEAVEAVLAGAK